MWAGRQKEMRYMISLNTNLFQRTQDISFFLLLDIEVITSSNHQPVFQDIHLALHVRSSRQALVESVYIIGLIKALQGIAVNAIQLSKSFGT